VEVHPTTPNDNIVKNKKSNQEEKINIIQRKPEKIEVHKITKIQ
jgi:hypothetical protein